MTLPQISLRVITDRIKQICVCKQETVPNSSRNFYNLVIETGNEGKLLNFLHFVSLDPQLTRSVISTCENLALLRDHECCVFAATNLSHDYISGGQILEFWSSRDERVLIWALSGGAKLSRTPRIQITATCDHCTMIATTLNPHRYVRIVKEICLKEYRRITVRNCRVTDAQLSAIISAKGENLVVLCKECGMKITTAELLDNDVKWERIGDGENKIALFLLLCVRELLGQPKLAKFVETPGEEFSEFLLSTLTVSILIIYYISLIFGQVKGVLQFVIHILPILLTAL